MHGPWHKFRTTTTTEQAGGLKKKKKKREREREKKMSPLYSLLIMTPMKSPQPDFLT